MSEYQYYEFLAIDRPLTEDDRREMRAISTRAEITSTSFTNHYEWGNFKGDPDTFMERWFDLHLYLANWGTRRLMIRLPRRLFDHDQLDRFLGEVDNVRRWVAGDNLILAVELEEIGIYDFEMDSGENWISRLAPLRSDLIAGDLRLLYLLWLTAVDLDAFEGDRPEPMSGIGPLTGSLKAFVQFFQINPDLVAAAAERPATTIPAPIAADLAQRAIAALPEPEKTDLLTRLATGDSHVAEELQARIRRQLAPAHHEPQPRPRTVSELRKLASAIEYQRQRDAAAAAIERRMREQQEVERARRQRLDAIRLMGHRVWSDVETAIERRNASGYDEAARLLTDLQVIAMEDQTSAEFSDRLADIRERHARKERFLERVAKLR